MSTSPSRRGNDAGMWASLPWRRCRRDPSLSACHRPPAGPWGSPGVSLADRPRMPHPGAVY